MSTETVTTNVDAEEIAKFEKLASRWWDRNSEFKPLHDINPLRAGFIDSKVNLAGKKVLDVGCGGGILSEAMAHRGAEVTGIDMGEAPLAVARLHLLESKLAITYVKTSAENWAAQHAGKYDVVTCLEMLEHVPDPASIITSISRAPMMEVWRAGLMMTQFPATSGATVSPVRIASGKFHGATATPTPRGVQVCTQRSPGTAWVTTG